MKNYKLLSIAGIICGIVSAFIFWWLSGLGFSLELLAAKDIKKMTKGEAFLTSVGLGFCAILFAITWYIMNIK